VSDGFPLMPPLRRTGMEHKYRMRMNELNEARSHPELNHKVDMVAQLRRYSQRADCFIRYGSLRTAINKNPNYDTPPGIYMYPLREMFDSIVENNIPHKGDANTVLLTSVAVTGSNVLNVKEYDGLDDDVKRLRDLLPSVENFDALYEKATSDASGSHTVSGTGIARPLPRAGISGRTLFYFTHNIARQIGSNNTSWVWRKILMLLGYTVVLDLGTSTIHGNEPFQILVMVPGLIKPIIALDNSRASSLVTVR
jgi:hypothetical protein